MPTSGFHCAEVRTPSEMSFLECHTLEMTNYYIKMMKCIIRNEINGWVIRNTLNKKVKEKYFKEERTVFKRGNKAELK